MDSGGLRVRQAWPLACGGERIVRWKRGVCGLLALLTSAASANDTIARIGVGGLEFTKSDAIVMVSEHLVISAKKSR